MYEIPNNIFIDYFFFLCVIDPSVHVLSRPLSVPKILRKGSGCFPIPRKPDRFFDAQVTRDIDGQVIMNPDCPRSKFQFLAYECRGSTLLAGRPLPVVALRRRAAAECRVRPAARLERHPLPDHPPRRPAVGQLVQVDRLVLQRPPQPLDEHVVHASAAAIHRAPDAGSPQPLGERPTRELAALIGVEDLWPPVPPQRLVERREAERGVQPCCSAATSPAGSPSPGTRVPPLTDPCRRQAEREAWSEGQSPETRTVGSAARCCHRPTNASQPHPPLSPLGTPDRSVATPASLRYHSIQTRS